MKYSINGSSSFSSSQLMTLWIFVASVPLLVAGGGKSNTLRSPLNMKAKFQAWMKEFNVSYKSVEEFMERMAIFADNHFFIEAHNSQEDKTYELGHNQFSSMTFEEYRAYNRLGDHSPGIVTSVFPRAQKDEEENNHDFVMDENNMAATERRSRALQQQQRDPSSSLPDEVNWVDEGAVPPVKNQGMCGSCWAFSAIGAIEGKHFLDTGDLVALSEQQLIDCDHLDLGCSGGLMDNAFLFDENSTGICSEIDYPYVMHKRWFRGCASEKGYCTGVNHTRVDTFIDVKNTADDLVAALADQPVSVAIEADTQSFQFYKSGVYSDPSCGENLDHGVLAVGYGSDNGTDYFLVRNSWGATWGDAGYIKMARTGSPNVNGTCGILGFASRPVLREDN